MDADQLHRHRFEPNSASARSIGRPSDWSYSELSIRRKKTCRYIRVQKSRELRAARTGLQAPSGRCNSERLRMAEAEERASLVGSRKGRPGGSPEGAGHLRPAKLDPRGLRIDPARTSTCSGDSREHPDRLPPKNRLGRRF